jgi:hypothetical protein
LSFSSLPLLAIDRIASWEKADRLDQERGPSSLEEVENAMKEMKTETAPGPDGFPVIFFKKIWGILIWCLCRSIYIM